MFCLLLVSAPLWAQSPPAPSPSPAPAPAANESRPRLVVRPSVAPVEEAFKASGLAQVRSVLVVTYDAEGVVTDVALQAPSGNAALDRAIVTWGRAVRLMPGKAGRGRLPFDLVNESLLPPALIDVNARTLPEIQSAQIAFRPPLATIHDAVASAGIADAAAQLMLAYDADGRVTEVQVIDSSGSLAIDAAIRNWATHVRVKTTAAGAGRLPFSFTVR